MDRFRKKKWIGTSPDVSDRDDEQSLNQSREYRASSSPMAVEMLLASNDQEHRKQRLSGAARKRMKFFISKGMPPDEARQEAIKPLHQRTTEPAAIRRNRSEDSMSEGREPKHPKQEAKWASQSLGASEASIAHGSTYSQVSAGLKVGIIDRNYPEILLEGDQLKAIEEAIMDEISDLGRDAAVKPSFQQLQYQRGWLCLTCSDKATAEWLKSIQSGLIPWEGADLRVVEEADVPHPGVLICNLPNSEDFSNEKILRMINNQNESITTSCWRVLRRRPCGTRLEVVISADVQSVERLRALRWRINYGFGQTYLCPKTTEKGGATSLYLAASNSQSGRRN